MRAIFRPVSALLLASLLAGCIFGGGEKDRPAPRQSAHKTVAAPPTNRETRQCYADLSRGGYQFRPLPDRDYGGGCEVRGAVQLLDIGVPVTGIKAMQCGLADKFTAWITHGVRPAAIQILGSDVVRVETYGTYACRNIRGNASASGKLSQHAKANAVDVSGFVLADGRHITVEKDWDTNDSRIHRFMEVIHASACKRFDTVLSPDYNAAHYNHFHIDMGGGHFCR
ncbi:extensin family protein [Stakelama sp. CBK3Z-3]|uniref:Extensin family protein n=1 Tax=Stakelama flava TaxID=2860338 RepID=A0ABS6XK53_9SPHN|nr:extensin family protein [Stakelama flava]MBW4330193.1 extensin family protein [Stakelama flava]